MNEQTKQQQQQRTTNWVFTERVSFDWSGSDVFFFVWLLLHTFGKLLWFYYRSFLLVFFFWKLLLAADICCVRFRCGIDHWKSSIFSSHSLYLDWKQTFFFRVDFCRGHIIINCDIRETKLIGCENIPFTCYWCIDFLHICPVLEKIRSSIVFSGHSGRMYYISNSH